MSYSDHSAQHRFKSNAPIRCVRLAPRLQMVVNESSCLESGSELKTEPSIRTLSAPISDAHTVFAYSITDEVNKIQYLSNTQTF